MRKLFSLENFYYFRYSTPNANNKRQKYEKHKKCHVRKSKMRKFAVNSMFDAPKATRSHKMHMKAIKKFIKTLFPFLVGFSYSMCTNVKSTQSENAHFKQFKISCKPIYLLKQNKPSKCDLSHSSYKCVTARENYTTICMYVHIEQY